MIQELFKNLSEIILSRIQSFYGDRLVSVVLFGSVARETQSFESDIDMVIVANGLPNGRMKRIREFEAVEKEIASSLMNLKKEGIHTEISAIIKTPEEVKIGSPLFLDMVEDAKILFDKDAFFSTRLAQLKEHLKSLGARRVWRGNAWYWILKPDFKPGEVFEL